MEFGQVCLLVLVCVMSTAALEFNPCYFWTDSVYANGKCFNVLQYQGNYDNAQTACGSAVRHGAVAEIRSKIEKDVLFAKLKGNVTSGLTLSGEETFTWSSDKAAFNSSLTPWKIIGKSDEEFQVNDCVMLTSNRQLQCLPCSQANGYTSCQTYAGNPCDLFLPGAEYYKGHCFLPVKEKKVQPQAQSFCEDREAFLAEPKTSDLQVYLTNFANRFFAIPGSITIGGIALVPGSWTWQTSGENFTDMNWSPNEPNQADKEIHTVMSSYYSWKWNNTPLLALSFICQRDIGDPCEHDLPGGMYMFGTCVKYISDKRSWRGAQAACNDRGSFLAEPKTSELSDSVMNYYNNIISNGDTVWIGGTDEIDGQWIWATSKDTFTYTDWNSREPNKAYDYSGPEDFIGLSPKDRSVGWNDIAESHLWGYLCQIDLTATTTESYLVVLPSTGKNISGGAHIYVTAGFKSHLVYLKLMTSSGQTIRTSVSYAKPYLYTVDEKDQLPSSTGSHTQYVLIKASNPITVVVSLASEDTHTTSITLIYPLSSLKVKDVFLEQAYFAYCRPSGSKSSCSLAVTSIMNSSNDVTIYLSKENVDVSLDVNQAMVKLRTDSPISGHLSQRFQTLYVTGLSDIDGAFPDSVQPVAVFVQSQHVNEGSGLTYLTYNQVLPIHLLDRVYVTFPDFNPGTGASTTLKIIAVHNDTNIMILGVATKTGTMLIQLSLVGQVTTMKLPGDRMYYLEGDKPFYVVLFAATADSTVTQPCMTPLLPSSLWSLQYDFVVDSAITLPTSLSYLVVIIQSSFIGELRTSPSIGNLICDVTFNTSWSVCHQELKAGENTTYYYIYLSNYTARFAAYLYSRSTQSCVSYPLGTASRPQATTDFDKAAYLHCLLEPTACFTEETTALEQQNSISEQQATTSEQETTTVEQQSTIIEQQMITLKQQSTTLEQQTTKPEQQTSALLQQSTVIECRMITLVTTERSTSSSSLDIQSPKSEIVTLVSIQPILDQNITADLEFKIHLAKLHINRRDTSSYRHSKMSADDTRISAAAIGFTGVAVVVAVIVVVVVSDLVNFCR